MFNVGDKVVYPMHGAGTIEGIEEKDILGEKLLRYCDGVKPFFALKALANTKGS